MSDSAIDSQDEDDDDEDDDEDEDDHHHNEDIRITSVCVGYCVRACACNTTLSDI